MIFYFIKYLHLMLYLSTSSLASIAHTPLHQHTNMKLISEFEMRISKFILWSRSSCSFDNWTWHSLRGSYWGVNPHLLKFPISLSDWRLYYWSCLLVVCPCNGTQAFTSRPTVVACGSKKKLSPTEALIRRIKFWCTSTAYNCSRSFFLISYGKSKWVLACLVYLHNVHGVSYFGARVTTVLIFIFKYISILKF